MSYWFVNITLQKLLSKGNGSKFWTFYKREKILVSAQNIFLKCSAMAKYVEASYKPLVTKITILITFNSMVNPT